MAQEYEVLQFKAGDFQDSHGNYWCDMALRGVSEPVRIVVKDPMQFHDGMMLYGRVEDATSKAGKPYRRFYREQKPDSEQSSSQHASKPKLSNQDDKYWDDKNAQIRAQWAIGQAVTLSGQTDHPNGLVMIEEWAKELYAMVDRVKGSSESTNPKVTQEKSESTQELQTTTSTISGYEKFKNSRPKAKTLDENNPEDASLIAAGYRASGMTEEELADIPF